MSLSVTPAPVVRALQRAGRSLAFRSGPVHRRLLRLLPRPRARPRPTLPLTLLTFGGAAHLEMLTEMLFSLQATWPALPCVRVACDSSLAPAAVRSALTWWQGPLEAVSWRDLAPAGGEGDRGALARFAEREPMGRKLAAVVASAAAGPTVYCDVDVLWFRLPERLEPLLGAGGTRLVMSQDYQPAYDPFLVPDRLSALAAPPFFCAGFLFATGDLLGACELGELLEYAARSGFGLTEQTILAEANRQLGGEHWTLEEVCLDCADRFSLGPSFLGRRWAARHYVGSVRHIFWRDALALRLGGRPASAANEAGA